LEPDFHHPRLALGVATALVCLAVTTMVATEKIYANVPADPTIVFTLTQADGTTFQARAWGDYFLGGIETVPTKTVSGYSIVFDEDSKNWMYAVRDIEGWLIASTNKVGQDPIVL